MEAQPVSLQAPHRSWPWALLICLFSLNTPQRVRRWLSPRGGPPWLHLERSKMNVPSSQSGNYALIWPLRHAILLFFRSPFPLSASKCLSKSEEASSLIFAAWIIYAAAPMFIFWALQRLAWSSLGMETEVRGEEPKTPPGREMNHRVWKETYFMPKCSAAAGKLFRSGALFDLFFLNW